MKKFACLFLALILVWLGFPAQPTHAASPGFGVENLRAAAQIDPDASFFQLLASPNQTGNIKVKISNYTNGTHRYKVAINRATTNANGEIDYTQHGKKVPAKSQANIETLFTKPKTVSIAPRSVQTVTMAYKTPAKPISGIILGGVSVTCLDPETNASAGLSSEVAYVTAVQLQATKAIPHFTPDLMMPSATAQSTSGGVEVIANLTNPLPVIQSKMTITAKLVKDGKHKATLKRTVKAARLAPNSHMPMALNLTPKDIKAGDYHVIVDAHLPNNQSHWHFSKPLHISQAVIKTTEAKAETHHLRNLPAWLIILLIAIIASLALLAIWLKMRLNEDKRA